jgi:hypothetical protein
VDVMTGLIDVEGVCGSIFCRNSNGEEGRGVECRVDADDTVDCNCSCEGRGVRW